MKKLFAILMVLALVAGSAFAEVGIGGNVNYGVNLASGSDGDDDKIYGGINNFTTQLFFQGENDDGTFGVYLRLQPDNNYWGVAKEYGDPWPNEALYCLTSANVWWKPIDQLKIRIGDDKDGFWGKDFVTGWGFARAAVDSVAVGKNVLYGGAFYGGFSGKGIMFEITPMDMLAINIALPYGVADNENPSTELADILHAFHFQAAVTLGFGDITLSYKNSAKKFTKPGKDEDYATMGDLYLAVGLNVIPNINLGVGLGFTIPNAVEEQAIRAGVSAEGNFGAFGFRARLQAIFGGNMPEFGKYELPIVESYNVKKDDFLLNFDVLPYYVVNDTFRVFFNLGLDMLMDDAASKTYIFFHVNPYIEIGSEWGPRFFAGIALMGATEDAADTTWAIPVGLKFSW